MAETYPGMSVRLWADDRLRLARAGERFYTADEEVANWLTHGVGAVLSGAALVLLVWAAQARGDVWHLASFAVFGVALLAVYTISTLYHATNTETRRKFLRRLDHAAIFVLIAATYTPFLLTKLRGPWGWTLFAVIWAICGTGALSEFFRGGRHRIASNFTYLLAGWLIVVAAKPLAAAVPAPALWLLLAGGVFYTGGVGFYSWERLRYHHAIWHVFVMAGSACHCLAIRRLLDPVY